MCPCSLTNTFWTQKGDPDKIIIKKENEKQGAVAVRGADPRHSQSLFIKDYVELAVIHVPLAPPH